jgi:hypothetical protein
LAGETLFQLPGQRQRLQVCHSSDQLVGVRVFGEFEECQRVPPGLGNDPVRDLTIAAEPCLSGEQRMRRFIGQTPDVQGGEPLPERLADHPNGP